MKEVMKLDNVTKTYIMGEDIKVHALQGVTMKICDNDFAAILGPSGSGKSTLLHVMGLLDTPSTGKRYIDGIETSTMSEDEQAKIRGEKIGFVFQTFNLISSLTALENVELPMMLKEGDGYKRKKRAADLLTQVGLGDRLDHLPGQLSGGQRQRVAIARALANNPEIILADEPTGNLDSKTGHEVLDIFKKLHKEGRTIIIITHDAYVAEQAKRMLKLMDGKVNDNNARCKK